MNALVLTGRVLSGNNEQEAWAKVAAFFKLESAAFRSRVLERCPIVIRETPDVQEAHRLRLKMFELGAEAELVQADGSKWQIENAGTVRGPVPLAFLAIEQSMRRLRSDTKVKRVADTTWIMLDSAVAGDTATRVSLQQSPELVAMQAVSSPHPLSPPPVSTSMPQPLPQELMNTPSSATLPPPPFPASIQPPTLGKVLEPPPLPPGYAPPQPAHSTLLVQQQQSTPTAQSATAASDEFSRIFVGNNYDYYLQKWEIARQHNSKRSWNWAAFFFSWAWMVYRKMYAYSAGFVIGAYALKWCSGLLFAKFLSACCTPAFVSLEGLSSFIFLITVFSYALSLAIFLTIGWYGNLIYKHHVEKKLREISAMNKPEQVRVEFARRGGTNIAAPFVCVGVLILIVLLYVIVASPNFD